MIAVISVLFVIAVLVVVSIKTARRPVNYKPPTEEDRLAAWEIRLGEWRAQERRRAARGRQLFAAGVDDALDAAHYVTGTVEQARKLAALRKKQRRKPKLSIVPSRSQTGAVSSSPLGAVSDIRPRAARGSDNAAQTQLTPANRIPR